MNRYLIETTHAREDCLHVLDNFVAYGHITHFEWGCENSICAGWAIIEAESEEGLCFLYQACEDKTKVVKLSKFSPENSGVSRRNELINKEELWVQPKCRDKFGEQEQKIGQIMLNRLQLIFLIQF
jgi:hypothetical protein